MRVADTKGRASCANCRFCDQRLSWLLGRPAKPAKWRCTYVNLAPADHDPLTGSRTVKPLYDYCSTRNSAGECEDWQDDNMRTLARLMDPEQRPIWPSPCATVKAAAPPVAPPSPHVFISAC